MAVKTAVGKLYALLSLCAPDDERAAQRLAYYETTESSEYRELAECSLFHKVFDEKFSPDVLKELDAQKLKQIREAAKIIPIAAERLVNAIYYGNGWELCELDVPDFYSASSVAALVKKLKFSTVCFNDTNIPPEDFTQIFKADKSPSADKAHGYYCIKREDGDLE